MSKLFVGDRVIGYFPGGSTKGTVREIRDNNVCVLKDEGGFCFFHPKQCRRLVVKNPRRRIWIEITYGGVLSPQIWEGSPPEHVATMEFLEVKKK